MSEMEMGPRLERSLEPNEFERELMRALRRVEAPEGFAARVMERAAGGAPARVRESGYGAPRVVTMRPRFGMVRMQAWVGGAIAAMLVLGVVGGEALHQRRERKEAAMVATQQFEAGVRVTDQALAQTRAQLQRAGLNLGD